MRGKRKGSLVGWTTKGWKIWSKRNPFEDKIMEHSTIFLNKEKPNLLNIVKVRITIEELPPKGKERG